MPHTAPPRGRTIRSRTRACVGSPVMAWWEFLFHLDAFRCARTAVTVPLTGRNLWKIGVAGACPRLPIAFGFRSHVACVYGTYQFLSSPYMTQSFCNQQSDRLFARIHHSNRNIRIWKITRITVRSKYVDNVQNPATLAPSSRKSVRR